MKHFLNSKRLLGVIACVVLSTALVGCASSSLKSPCPDYGKYCDKKPVNSWDTTYA